MAKILGIDLGTNSLGWSFVDNETNEIIDAGSRIFPEGVNKVNGKETPKNLNRRLSRGGRKNNFRYKLRRNKLRKILNELNMSPNEKYFTLGKNKNYDQNNKKIKRYAAKELYELRVNALNQLLSLDEIGRIFYHFNTHRGFKSNAKEKAIIQFTQDENKKQQQGIVEKSTQSLQDKISLAKAEGNIKHGTIGEYFYYLIKQSDNSHNLNAPIENIRNSDADEKFGHYTLREMFEKEFDLIWEKQSEFHQKDNIFNVENKKKIKDETIFYQRNLRSSKHLVGKCPFEYTEYKKQITDENKELKTIVEKSYLKCIPKSSFLFQEYRIWDTLNNLQYQNSDDDWFELDNEQKRKLANKLEYLDSLFLNKPDKRCKFENKELKKIAEEQVKELRKELSLPIDVVFNISKIIGNRTVVRLTEALGKEEWERIGEDIKEENISFTNKYTGEVFENLVSPIKYSKKQETLWHLVYFSSHFTNSQEWLLGKEENKNKNILNTFKKFALNETQIFKLSSVILEPDYASYSSKAISKLLPFLKTSDNLHTAEQKAYDKSNSDTRTNDNNLLYKIPLLPNNYLKNPIVQQGSNEAIRLINKIIEENNLGKPDEIRIELTRELKKPKFLREEQKRRNDEKNALRTKYSTFLTQRLGTYISRGDSRIDKFELWLELSWSKKAFDEIQSEISLKEFTIFCRDIDDEKIKDYQRKYELWLECGRILPYTNEVIGLEQLFSPEIEIEHIIPYSRCFDNSFQNKTLSSKRFNNAKGNKTPSEYYDNQSPKEWEQFKRNIRNFSKSKQKRFLMASKEVDSDFKNSQLNNTSYSTTLLAERLRKSFKFDQIKITNGAITSIIRKLFGLETILNPPERIPGYENGKYWAVYDENNKLFTLITYESDEKPEVKEGYVVIKGYVKKEKLYVGKIRNDHRHHTVDAIAIAFTNQRMIQFISTITEGYYLKDGNRLKEYQDGAEFVSAFDEYGHFTKDVWDAIREEAKKHFDIRTIRNNAVEKISNLIVSHKSDNKLTSSGRKKIYKPNGKPLKITNKEGEEIDFYSGGNVARGQLHEATLYGKIYYNQPKDDVKKEWMQRDGVYVYRVDLKYATKNYFSTVKQLEKIVDPVIRKMCIDAAKEKGLKAALEEGIYLPNNSKKSDLPNTVRNPIKVKSVRIVNESSNLLSIRSYKEQKKDYKKAYIETGDNYCIVVYGDWEGEKRDFDSVTFLRASKVTAENKKRKKDNLPEMKFYQPSKNGLNFLMTLSKGDLVLVYEKHPDEVIGEMNPDILFKKLFKVIKSDKNGKIILGRHNLSNIKADTDPPVTDINTRDGSVIRKQYSTIKAIKVTINELGKIEKYQE